MCPESLQNPSGCTDTCMYPLHVSTFPHLQEKILYVYERKISLQTPPERGGSVATFKETEQICAVTAGDVSSHVQVEGSSQKLVEASKGLGQNAESKPHRTMLLDGARGVWM